MAEATAYERWIRREGIPIVEGYGVEDFRDLPRAPWPRTGGKGAFIQLKGQEGFTGMYIAEIPPGGVLNPEKHLYDEIICILQGRGATEVWWGNDEGRKVSFEWGEDSVFAIPLNSTHRFLNGSREPVVLLGVSSAPPLMDLIHDVGFVFGCDYTFNDRFDGRPDYYIANQERSEHNGYWSWDTNFISDIKSASIDPADRKGTGVRITALEMAGNALVGHIAEWPVGLYHKAHHHQGGAILLILRSQGYTLMWPNDLGTRPYRAGRGSQVVRVDWREGSIFSPPTAWFHQHFNTGKEPARQLALRYTDYSGRHAFGIVAALNRAGVRISTRDGGTLIEYEDEDPQIRSDYVAELRAKGVASQLPDVIYRED